MKKRVFRSYAEKECDEFAAYLTEMSIKGWQFAGWKCGMVFVKDGMTCREYAVEVFPGGHTEGLLFETEKQEFSGYCQAAGWKLIDSNGKLCVFCKESEDAGSIMTPQERFENIRKEEWKKRRNVLTGAVVLLTFYIVRLSLYGFSSYIFFDPALILLLGLLMKAVLELGRMISFFQWKQIRKQELKEQKLPWYGARTRREKFVRKAGEGLGWLTLLILVFLFGISAFREHWGRILIPATSILFVAELLILIVSAVRRLPGESLWMVQFVASLVAVIYLTTLGMAAAFELYQRQDTVDLSVTEDGKLLLEHQNIKQGVLGESWSGSITFLQDNDPDNWLWMDIYESKYPWVLDRIFREKQEKLRDGRECSTAWEADRAVSGTFTQSGQEACIRLGTRICSFRSGTRRNLADLKEILYSLGISWNTQEWDRTVKF